MVEEANAFDTELVSSWFSFDFVTHNHREATASLGCSVAGGGWRGNDG